jgi:DNA modification methylase
LNFLEEVFKEVHRITKEGRFFILNTSPIIIPRISRAHASKRYPIPFDIHPLLVKMGWEFIDDIIWVKPEASVKNRNAGFLQHRKPLAYKPNSVTEMLMVYRKKTDKLIDWNIQQYGFEKLNRSKVVEKYETTNVWRIDPTFDKIHSAVFPLELCNRVIKYYSYVEDLVFDPFAGSGTLGRAAINLNRFYFLTEMEAKYIDRIKEEFGKSGYLFDQNSQPKYYIYEEFITKTEGS